MAYLATFKRTEKKYLMTKEKFQLLNEKINGRLQMDKYGEHTICNVYFDTDDYRLICESIEKPKYKEKLRVRCYGKADADSDVFLELKKKYKGVVYKRRVALSAKQAMEFTQNRVYPFESQVLREIEYFMDFYKCTPKVFIAYDRIALTYPEDKNFRVTFDKNIRSRMDNLDLTMGDSGNHLLKDGYVLMEVKAAGAMPLWFAQILNELEIYPTSFSKYGNIYKAQIFPTLNNQSNNDNNIRSEILCSQVFSQQLLQALASVQ